MHKKYLALITIGFLALGGCDLFAPKQQEVVIQQTPPEPTNTPINLDLAETNKFKSYIFNTLGNTASGPNVERMLKGEGFDCGLDPNNKIDNACIKVVTAEDCTTISYIKTNPYMIDSAQVIKTCKINPK